MVYMSVILYIEYNMEISDHSSNYTLSSEGTRDIIRRARRQVLRMQKTKTVGKPEMKKYFIIHFSAMLNIDAKNKEEAENIANRYVNHLRKLDTDKDIVEADVWMSNKTECVSCRKPIRLPSNRKLLSAYTLCDDCYNREMMEQ